MSVKASAVCLSLILSLAIDASLSRGNSPEENPRYLDPSTPVEQRIDDLLPRMTIEEKIIQISDDWGSKGNARLKIPPLLKTEGLHGQSYATGATIFPQAIAMAATFDPDITAKIGKQTAIEAKAAHIRSSWSPVLDVARDVRWGRVEETYGEDPYLASCMGVAWIRAFQDEGMIAVPKHFAGHGQPLGGRDSNDAGLSDRVLREIHLPSFRAAVEEAHAGGVMAAYTTWHGVPDNASTDLLQKILRQEWGFDGYVVSDCDGPNHFMKKYAIVKTPEEAAALAATAGVNMECGSIYKQGLAQAIRDGLITEGRLDEIVRPILRAKFKLGLFEHPDPQDMQWGKLPQYDTAEARALARDVEVEGAVLLKNDKKLLPLSKELKTIAVIGPDADSPQTGDYTGHASPGQLISVLAGIKSHAGSNTQVVYAPGLSSPLSTDTSKFDEAVAAAKQADVAVVVVGDNSNPEGNGQATSGENNDGATLDFPGAQRDLIKAVQATGTPVVLVLVNGKVFTLPWEAEHIPAILATWYPGEEGGDATADILFGDRNPSGRLPITWPRSVGQLPLNYDYLPSGRGYKYYDMPFAPQFRFGYGLSYTKFSYSNLQITPKEGDPGYVHVTADVENIGDRDGDEVAQLYITDLNTSVNTRVLQLEAFKRLSISKGEKKTVSFDLTPFQLSLLDAKMVRRVEAGTFRIHVGGVSPEPPDGGDDHKLHVSFNDRTEGVSKEFQEPKDYSAKFVYTLTTPGQASAGRSIPATVTVKNTGDLTDVTDVRLYSGDELDSWSFELNPGETKSHEFQTTLYSAGPAELAAVTDSKLISKTVQVDKAPAHVEFKAVSLAVDNRGTLQFSADAQNVGSEPFEGSLGLKVDGQAVGQKQALVFQPGERKRVSLSYLFPVGGLHRVQINDMPEQQIVVPGGLGLAVRDPVIYLKLDEGMGGDVKNEVTGKTLSIKGAPVWAEGKDGHALALPSKNNWIDAGNIELYRKAFTLSAWVKISQLSDNGDLAIFGGQAPMGADQDTSGTTLHAGIHNNKPFLGFFGRDIQGDKSVPPGDWVNLTYTYDPQAEIGALYINGTLDKSESQKPYAGPLSSIGDAPILQHGNYLLDNVVVTQSCFTPAMVRLLSDKGFESFLQGEYTSDWHAFDGAPETLDAFADIPEGAHITVIVETGDKSGKVVGSATAQLKPGQQSYPLPNLQSGQQIRIRAQLLTTGWGGGPVLRSVTLQGGRGGNLHWSAPDDWSKGNASDSLISNYDK
jgi:beta-glucosidase